MKLYYLFFLAWLVGQILLGGAALEAHLVLAALAWLCGFFAATETQH